MTRLKTLLCGAVPFGYGPAAKLLTLAPLLRRHWQLIFVGHGVAWELVSRSPECFTRIVETNAAEPCSQAFVESASAVLSIMDREIAAAASEAGKPCYAVDSLLWLRDGIPREFAGASVYWAQRFGSDDEMPTDCVPRPTLIGPIVSPGVQTGATKRAGLLVHLGGCEGASQSAEAYRAYGEFVLRGIAASGLTADFSQQMTVVGGSRCVASLRSEFGGQGWEFLSLSPTAMNARVRAARLVLTAPGPTNVLECFHSGAPVGFLPPQNYSQWSTLRRLERQGLAPGAMNWDDAWPDLPLRERMPEAERKPVVQEALSRMTNDDVVGRELADRLSRWRQVDLADLANRQTKFFRSLGSNGAQSIARQLRIEESLMQGAA